MSKYIDADKLIAEIRRIVEEETPISKGSDYYHGVADTADKLLSFITSLQQDKDVLDLCSRIWWGHRGWIMIPPNVTLKGIESLLERVRHKIKWNEENGIEEQEQPDVDLEKEINNVIADYSFTKTIDSGGFKTTVLDYAKIARHFYELGLNARKEENEL